MKVIYLIAGLYRSAGMERVVTMKANWLATHGYEIMIVTTEQKGRPIAFPLDSSIRTADLCIGYEDNNGSSFIDKTLHYPFLLLRHRIRLARLLKKERPDVTISTFSADASFLPSIKDGSRKVLEYHFCKLKREQYERTGIWALADRIRSANDERIIRRYESFVVLTEQDAGFWGRPANIRVIPNPRSFTPERASDLNGHQVIAIGRYTAQKGFDMLLKAWAALPHRDWTLRLAGEGEDSFNADGVITGRVENIESELMKSSIFALSSRYEGLPMALLEAQSCGVPSVCFDCKCGPSEIIEDGQDGFLIPEGDCEKFATALKTLMDNDLLRHEMGTRAFENSKRFDIEKIMTLWTDLLGELS